ncbi:beta-1,4-galactosyltransferase 2-like isoform X3 [Biomphalaria glabrata]|uniref:Beta-1,4-galactosyltransferase n=1 Tax=Biomphalaria glabrata TaxID=6526 RepID=A0A9W3B0C7_BIOGL|nr:beta-1,4-galactosyltransferase 2-like isoform X3 [Biomphalaria glabrata]
MAQQIPRNAIVCLAQKTRVTFADKSLINRCPKRILRLRNICILVSFLISVIFLYKLSFISNRNTGQCVGRLDTDKNLISLKQLGLKFQHLFNHGRLQPRDCQALQRLAIIIPFRKRWSHLIVLLNNLIPLLSRQQADVHFFVVEQSSRSTFNRGALQNVGFLEALQLGQFDCFIFHDVDLVPLNDKNLYRCGDNPRHFSVALNKYSYSLLYPGYFGGVVGLSTQQYRDINGNSNLYVGWGGEDDDLLERLLNKGYYISRYATDLSKYDMIQHGMEEGNKPNPFRLMLLETARVRQEVDGLTSIQYNKTITDLILFTLITVDIDNEQLLRAAPEYIQNIMATTTEKQD